MILAAILAALQAPPSPPPPSANLVSASLAGRSQCVAFEWVADAKGAKRAAIGVPVIINGSTRLLQLDTGSDVSMLHGGIAERAGWSQPGQKTFRATTFSIGSTAVDRPTVQVNIAMNDTGKLGGTLGLPAFMGSVTVIDYPHQRPVYTNANNPMAFAQWPIRADGVLGNASLWDGIVVLDDGAHSVWFRSIG